MTNLTGLCVVLFVGSMFLATALPGLIHAVPSTIAALSAPDGR